MTTTRQTRQADIECFGLLANGSSGPWEIAIDETTSGADRWYAQIDGPSVSFYFEIPSVDIVGEMIRFFERASAVNMELSPGSAERNENLVVGKDKNTPVTLVKDDEYPDRFFLVIGSMSSPIVHYVIAGAD